MQPGAKKASISRGQSEVSRSRSKTSEAFQQGEYFPFNYPHAKADALKFCLVWIQTQRQYAA